MGQRGSAEVGKRAEEESGSAREKQPVRQVRSLGRTQYAPSSTKALMVPGVLELVLRRPAVVDLRAVVVEPQDGFGHGAAAGGVDDVSSGLRPDQRVQPGGKSAHPP